MRIKPTEVKMVAALLEQEHPDAASLAKSIIMALDEKRLDDPMYVLGTMYESVPLLWGPFATENQAAKAAGKIAAPRPLQGRVLRVKRIDEEIEE